MAQDLMTVVFSYDIQDNRIRRKVAKALEDHLVRVQKSVFEARLTRKQADVIFDHIQAQLTPRDSLRMYVLTKPSVEKSRTAGAPPLPEEGNFWLL